jgi:hypothetical protein
MSRLYGPVHRSLQDRFETRRLADNVETRVVLTEIPQEHKAFIESRDMFFLSTIDHQGRPTVSYKGGDPGFAKKLPLTQRTPSVSCKLLRRSKADGNEDQQLFHLAATPYSIGFMVVFVVLAVCGGVLSVHPIVLA